MQLRCIHKPGRRRPLGHSRTWVTGTKTTKPSKGQYLPNRRLLQLRSLGPRAEVQITDCDETA